MKVEMTGRQDREGPWKLAIVGFPGAGKTLFASTAKNPLFVFFQENPRLKSIANRHVAHVKIVNEERSGGVITVQDRLNSLMLNLMMNDHEYQTLVIDTGDELFQAMKQGRRLKTGGEFGPGDWGWLADSYRDVVTGLIDLPMDVIILYHMKNDTDGEDGYLVRNLSLQGSSQDEAPGWFDVVGALDTFDTTDEDGDDVARRVILTHSSRMYPWAKDHSGALGRFEISDNFVDDFPRMLELLHAGDDVADSEVLEELDTPERPVTDSKMPPPSPEELQVKKTEKTSKDEQADEQNAEQPKEEEPVEVVESIPTESDDDLSAHEAVTSTPPSEEQDGESPAMQEAEALVTEELDATPVPKCAECGEEVADTDLLEIAQIRFRKPLCRTHFKEKLAEGKK